MIFVVVVGYFMLSMRNGDGDIYFLNSLGFFIWCFVKLNDFFVGIGVVFRLNKMDIRFIWFKVLMVIYI